jgi:uncharacterized protein YbjT (DUF2867 family)
MKLAEALILRADAQKRLQQLRERLIRSAKVQEGELPPENPQELLAELDRVLGEFNSLVKSINRTNALTVFDQTRTLTEALADRDTLALERHAIQDVINTAAAQQFRYGRSEIRYITTVDVGALQKRSDDLARRYRELDAAIQAANWTVEME